MSITSFQKLEIWREAVSVHLRPVWKFLHTRRKVIRQASLAMAIVLCAIGVWVSIQLNPDILGQLRPEVFVALLLVVQPLTVLLGIADFALIARLLNVRAGFKTGLEVVVYSRLANFLPIPGGTVTRLAALKAKGVSIKIATPMLAMATGLSGALAFIYSGSFLSDWRFTTAFLFVGACGLVFSLGLSISLKANPLAFVGSAIVRLLIFALEAFALSLAAKALSLELSFAQASVLVVSSFLATAVAITPGGLGVREILVALMAPLIGIDPAAGFLIAFVLRLSGYVGLIAIAAFTFFLEHPGDVGRGSSTSR